MAAEIEPKWCAVCGRRIAWRRKWARDWDSVRYCSKRCRGAGLSPRDRDLEQAILALLVRRARGATICPSEAARQVHGDEDDGWRDLMEAARSAARRLVVKGQIEIVQRGRAVDPSNARGPIRLRLR